MTWLCIPTKRPVDEAEIALSAWRAQGYKLALFVDAGSPSPECDLRISAPYEGYPHAVNALVRAVLAYDKPCDWVVTAGDDTLPDPIFAAADIAAQLTFHFEGTFGVCQATGDRFAGGSIDRICGSPWMGREWCLRANQGKGPLWPEYTHMFVDEELQNVAIKYGAFWQRPDLIHLHRHFQRESDALDSKAVHKETPAHLIEANSTAHWHKYKNIFTQRKAAGFPGSEPL